MGLGGQDGLQVIVHLRVRDVTPSERVLQAPYGRFAVVLGDLRRHVLRHRSHPVHTRSRFQNPIIRPKSRDDDQTRLIAFVTAGRWYASDRLLSFRSAVPMVVNRGSHNEQ
jgi:hypothetical protein